MARVRCPFCAESIEIVVDDGGGEEQEYIEDCSVCCRPIRFVVHTPLRGDAPSVQAYRE